jgi:uncharacterized protein
MLPDDVDTAAERSHVEGAPTEESPVTEGTTAELAACRAPAPAPREPFWGYADLALVLGILVAFVVLMIAGVGALALVYPKLRSDPTPLLVPTQLLLYGFVYLSFWLDFKSRYNRPVLSSLGWRPARINLILCGAGGFALAFAISALASLLHTPTITSPFDKLTTSALSTVLFGIMAVVLGPFFEELFFRGFVQPLLTRTFGTIAGILLTAALFGGLHAPEYSWAWQYALAVTLAGAVFGWLREKTNSIVPSTVMHACFNGVSFAALAFKHNS